MSEGKIIEIYDQGISQVIEHRAEVKKCSCSHINRAQFPEGLNRPVQYGNRLKATSVYLNQYQFIPYDRQEEVFEDLFNHHISKGTSASINKACYNSLDSIKDDIKQVLKNDKD